MESKLEQEIEELSAKIHDIYMIEAKRQGDVRHKDKYQDLAENIKEFDRVLARYILSLIQEREKQARVEGMRIAFGREYEIGDGYTRQKYSKKEYIEQALSELEQETKNDKTEKESK